MTIQQIARKTKGSPYFFHPDTLVFFGQTLEGFDAEQTHTGKYMISQKITDPEGKHRGLTVRFYNPKTRELDFIN